MDYILTGKFNLSEWSYLKKGFRQMQWEMFCDVICFTLKVNIKFRI